MNTFVNENGDTETAEELKAKYNPEGSVLRKFQMRMFDLLVYFDKVCRENGIEYMVSSGAVLGAVRHGGFIPWDDDMDVYIKAKDRRKIQKLLLSEKYAHPQFVLQCRKTDPGYYLSWLVLRDKNSEYVIDDVVHNAKKYRGAQLDIFPMSHIVPRPLCRLCRGIEVVSRKFFIGRNKFMADFLYGLEHYVAIPVCKFISLLAFPIYGRKWLSIYRHDWATAWRLDIRASSLFPTGKIMFEGKEFPGPHNAHEYCVDVYRGGYMTLPAPEKRDHHSVIEYRIW